MLEGLIGGTEETATGLVRLRRLEQRGGLSCPVLAVNEAAANALEYAEAPRSLRLWRQDCRVVAEVVARGRIDDPLAGMRRPDPRNVRGRGLWIVNQLCDLVQVRDDGVATAVRMHMRCCV